MGSRSGYEYRYLVSVDNGFQDKRGLSPLPFRTYILQVRTNFILKPIRISRAGAVGMLMGTERFADEMSVNDDEMPMNVGEKALVLLSGKNKLDRQIRNRLSLYCMPDAQIRALAQTAFDIVRDPRNDSLHTIPIMAVVDVCTVQLEGEQLDATIDRSVKPEFLIPLKLRCSLNDLSSLDYLKRYLDKLPVVRVREDVVDVDMEMESCPICIQGCLVFESGVLRMDKYANHEEHSIGRKEGMDLMEACPICLREPMVGAKIASLPCKHAFHDHCIFRWLLKCQSCPLCRVEIETKEDYSKLLIKYKREISG